MILPNAYKDTLRKYIGIPFKDNGRDFNGCDCYGVVFLFYRDILGINLPDLTNDYNNSSDYATIARLMARYHENWTPSGGQWGDVLVFRGVTPSRNRLHLGIYLESGKMLHTLSGADSCIESYTSSLWRNRFQGAFHYANRSLS